jgi:hypothetical protein
MKSSALAAAVRLPVFLCFLLTPLLISCSAIRPWSLSASDLEDYTRKAFRQFDNQQLQSGSPLSFTLNELSIDIGPDGREVVLLSLELEAALNAFLVKVPANLYLKMEGQPFYDGKEKAIYLKRLRLLDSRLKSSFLAAEIDPVAKQAFSLIGQMFEHVPVYRLNQNNLTERLLMTAPLNIRVMPGRIGLEMVAK